MAAYRAFYAKQLPGMPFYHDACHALLTLGGDTDVLGGATFRLLGLATPDGCSVLILDVLALAVDPTRAQRGVGSTIVSALKAVAQREAAAARVERPLLLTQADLGCVRFWEKQAFTRALDANALVRTMRRQADLTIFLSATPMGCALPPVKK